jgi:antitoxin CptB
VLPCAYNELAALKGAINPLRRCLMSADIEMKRLFWHSRRGMLELDVLLLPFLQEAYSDLEAADKERFSKLLTCEDQDMFGWFMQRSEPDDPDLKRMVRMILDRVQPN